MSRRHERNKTPQQLRARAETVWQERHRELSAPPPEQLTRLVHELEVHQIELELQNEELRRAQGELEESRRELSDLYDFAPAGYLTIDQHATIVQANLTVATMLGVERLRLVGQNFNRFISRASRDALYKAQRAVGPDQPSWSGELVLRQANGGEFPVSLQMVGVGAQPHSLRCVVIDITARVAAERALRESEDQLRQLNEQLEKRVTARTSELARTNAALEEEVRQRREGQEQINALFGRLVSVQEDERRRIARDIHDELGQQITALRLSMELLRTNIADNAPAAKQVERTTQLAEEIDRSIDSLSSELRPPSLDDLGLAAALDHLLKGWSERTGVAAELAVPENDARRLPEDIEVNLYRVTQEALHNVVKHAQATRVSVELHVGEETVLVISDNGLGFDPVRARVDSDGFGLISMRERAALIGGKLDIESAPQAGTSIVVCIPINTRPPH
jgi:PAS domain S-box-containing protein